MTSKTRAKLRSLATAEQPIFQVGKDGVTDAVAAAVDDALSARELVKLTVLKTAESPAVVLETLSKRLHAEPITAIGHKIVRYRTSENEKARHIEL